MGVKGQAHIIDNNVWLYQEYDGYNLLNVVRKGILRGKSCWNDPECLARIIFSDMIREHIYGTTDYGIGTDKHNGVEWAVEIDCRAQTVTVNLWDKFLECKSFEDFVSDDKQPCS